MKNEGGEHLSAIEESLWALRNSYSNGTVETEIIEDLEFAADHVRSPQGEEGLSLANSSRQEDDVMSIGLDFLLEGSGVGHEDRLNAATKPETAEQDGQWQEDEPKSFYQTQKEVMTVGLGSPSSPFRQRDFPPHLLSPLVAPKLAKASSNKPLILDSSTRHDSISSDLAKREDELLLCRSHSHVQSTLGRAPSGTQSPLCGTRTVENKCIALSAQIPKLKTHVPMDSSEFRAEAIARFRAKKAARKNSKLVRYECRKRIASTRPRVGGRFAKTTKS